MYRPKSVTAKTVMASQRRASMAITPYPALPDSSRNISKTSCELSLSIDEPTTSCSTWAESGHGKRSDGAFCFAQSPADRRRAAAARSDGAKNIRRRHAGSKHCSVCCLSWSGGDRQRSNSPPRGSALSLSHQNIEQLGQGARAKSDRAGRVNYHEPGCAQSQQVADRSSCRLRQYTEVTTGNAEHGAMRQ